MHRVLIPVFALLLAALSGSPALAQSGQTGSLATLSEFDAGDLEFRTHVYMEFSATTAPAAVLVPGFGLGGATFREQPDGDPSWARMLGERGWNAFSLDQVGCGAALPPPSTDILQIMEKGLFGVYQIGMATAPRLYIAQGQAAGMALKARSWDVQVADSMVLIDPMGPQGIQPMTEVDPAARLDRRRDLKNALWREWGFGPRHDKLRRGLDLSAEDASALIESYERDQPAYWTGLLTGMDSGFELREPIKLKGMPVLVVRTPAADAEQIERETAVRAWLEEIGTEVAFLDLAKRELGDVSGLPWAGDRAENVLEEILAWWDLLEIPFEGGEASSR